jgi:hypothetical protein
LKADCTVLAAEDLDRVEEEEGDEGLGGKACWPGVEIGDVGQPGLNEVLEIAEEGAE